MKRYLFRWLLFGALVMGAILGMLLLIGVDLIALDIAMCFLFYLEVCIGGCWIFYLTDMGGEDDEASDR